MAAGTGVHGVETDAAAWECELDLTQRFDCYASLFEASRASCVPRALSSRYASALQSLTLGGGVPPPHGHQHGPGSSHSDSGGPGSPMSHLAAPPSPDRHGGGGGGGHGGPQVDLAIGGASMTMQYAVDRHTYGAAP